MDENAPLSWIEQTLIEAWAGSSAPPGPPSSTDGVDPWYSCYTNTAPTVPKPQITWQKCIISDESDVRHGCAYYYHEVSQTTQWERPNGYESPIETDFLAADDEARRQARFLSGELDEQSEAAAALNRCIELLAVRGDDAAALALMIKGCGIGPERLLKAQRGKRSLLAEAAVRGAATCVALLVDAFGADVNDTDNLDADNSSPLHLACWNGQSSAVEALLARGATMDSLNKWRETPAESARARGYDHCANMVDAALIESHGGQANERLDVDYSQHQEIGGGDTWQQNGELDDKGSRSMDHSLEKDKGTIAVAEARREASKVKVVVLRGGPLPHGTSYALRVEDNCADCSLEQISDECSNRKSEPTVKDGREAVAQSAEVQAVPVLRIGRARDGDKLVLSELAVSKKHAQIAWLPEAHSFALRDEGSKHGIKLRGAWHPPPAAGTTSAFREKEKVAGEQCESANVSQTKCPSVGPWLSVACGDEFEIGSTVLCLQAVDVEEGTRERTPFVHKTSENHTGEIVSTFKPSAKLIAAEASCNLRMRRDEKEKQQVQQQKERDRAKHSRDTETRDSSGTVDFNPAPHQRRRGVTWGEDVVGGEQHGQGSSASQQQHAGDDAVVPGTAAAVAAGVGGAMLRQMGWQSGQGLGKLRDGVSAPLEVTPRLPFSGLGASQRLETIATTPAGPIHGQIRDEHRAYKTVGAWERMKARFDAAQER